jgi:hypothetical protein
MGGGLMQLVAYGAQDVYLTGNPQITFFKVVYRRHTNFSMETIEQTINGTSTLNGSKTNGTVTISRNGDLVHKLYVTSSTAGITNGSEIVNEVELEIGGQRIDKHTAEWMQVWNELTTPESKAIGLKAMAGDIGATGTTGAGKVHIPLQFWFCRNPGLALPLIALQYHEVKLKCTWGTETATGATTPGVKVWADYIYLDTDERRRFAQISHEYLIEQLQTTPVGTSTGKVQLNFNHPVKELIWTDSADGTGVKTKLTLNGHDRFAEQEPEYFQLRQPYDHHTAVPKQNLPFSAFSSNDVPVLSANIDAAKTGANAAAADATSEACIVQVTALGAIAGIAVADGTNATPNLVAVFAGAANTFNGTPKVGDIHRIDINDGGVNLTSTFGTIKRFYLEGDGAGTASHAGLVDPFTNLDLTNCVAAAAGNVIAAAMVVIEYEEDIVTAAYVPAGTADNIVLTKVGEAGCRTSKLTKKINCYSFALKPEEHQPSGTCNFSRIDNANLVTTATSQPTIGTIFAVNYNVLRIMSGMGGLAYSN